MTKWTVHANTVGREVHLQIWRSGGFTRSGEVFHLVGETVVTPAEGGLYKRVLSEEEEIPVCMHTIHLVP